MALYAQFGKYKSFIAADIAASVASGIPAFGKLAVLRPGEVIYSAGEGLPGLETQRFPALRFARGMDPSLALSVLTIDGVPSVARDDVGEYIAAIDALPEKPRLIIIDTFARAMVGLDENSAKDASLYLAMAESLARQYDCCVLTLLHMGKDESRGARGSSALPAGFDAVFRIDADTANLTATIRPVKLKDGAEPEPIHLKGREVELPGGKTSLVFDRAASGDIRKNASISSHDVGAALRRMGVFEGQSEPVTTHALAMEIAGPGAAVILIEAKAKTLRRYAEGRFAAYVVHHGSGRGDASLWSLPFKEEGAPHA